MKKYQKTMMSLLLCLVAVMFCGCSQADQAKEQAGQTTVPGQTAVPEQTGSADLVTLADYEEISLKKSDIEQQVQSEIDSMLDRYAEYKKKKTGKVKSGDSVNIYYVGKIDGKKFEGGSCTKKDSPNGYNLTIGSGTFIPGFEDGLIGARVGSVLDVDVAFPDPYPNNPDLAGKKAVFTVTVNYVQGKKVLPELTGKFVQENLPTYKSVEDYKTTLRGNVLEEMAWDDVYSASTVNEYPEDQVQSTYDQLNTSIQFYLKQNNYTLSDYLSAQNVTSSDFEDQMRETARMDVSRQLVYGAIAEKEDLVVSDEEYQEGLEKYLSTYGCEDEEALNKQFQDFYGTDASDMIKDELLFKKVKSFLVDHVIEEK